MRTPPGNFKSYELLDGPHPHDSEITAACDSQRQLTEYLPQAIHQRRVVLEPIPIEYF